MIEKLKIAAGFAEAEVALAIAVPLKRETHRPSCSVAQEATGAMRDHLAEAEVALAVAVQLIECTEFAVTFQGYMTSLVFMTLSY